MPFGKGAEMEAFRKKGFCLMSDDAYVAEGW